MKKGIFLGDKKQIDSVYPEALRAALGACCALEGAVFTKEAVLRDPTRYGVTPAMLETMA